MGSGHDAGGDENRVKVTARDIALPDRVSPRVVIFHFPRDAISTFELYVIPLPKRNFSHPFLFLLSSQTSKAMSAASTPPLTLIVAATVKNGIGKNGTLPWPMLKKEMAYFARVTKRVPTSPSSLPNQIPTSTNQKETPQQPHQNVVIMGRKTWDSIPPKFRPLAHRTNLVISTQSSLPSISPAQLSSGNVLLSQSIPAGLAALTRQVDAGISKPLGRVFVIGGAALYKAALESECAGSVLLTRVGGEWDCDTVFPLDLEADQRWVRKERGELEGFTGEEFEAGTALEEVVDGKRVGYEFLLYERL